MSQVEHMTFNSIGKGHFSGGGGGQSESVVDRDIKAGQAAWIEHQASVQGQP